jgi:thiol-disulfide isomerase/thioredoxin
MNKFSLPLLVVLASVTGFAVPKSDYPAYVKKTLYADHDIRGKSAPKLHVEKWLTGSAPNTKGKIVVIDFWATWCPPCRALIPEMNGWAAKFKGKVDFIGISDESAATVSSFMKSTPMHYSVGLDPSATMSKAIGVQGIPHVIIETPDGVVRWQGFPLSGEDRLTADKIQAIVDTYAAKK